MSIQQEYQKEEIWIVYLKILNAFFSTRGYALSYLFIRKKTDRDGSMMIFSKLKRPWSRNIFFDTTFYIEFVGYSIINFTRTESRCFRRKKVTNIKALINRSNGEPPESFLHFDTLDQLEKNLLSYCQLIDDLFLSH